MATFHTETILVLSSDRRLIEGIRDVTAPAAIRALPCLRELPTGESDHYIIVDPRQFRQCCLKAAMRLGEKIERTTLRTLALPSLYSPLLEISHRGRADAQWQNTTGTGGEAAAPSPRAHWAWRRRGAIFGHHGSRGIVGRFLDQALEHSLGAYSVAVAASELGSSSRQLDRCCRRSLACTPGLLIDLARVMAVAEDLVHSARPLELIAFRHGFHDAATMSRLFVRFTGRRPGLFRLDNAPSAIGAQVRRGRNCH
jgi:AraC-like DNA-binding protein